MAKLICTDCEAIFDERDATPHIERTKSEAWGVTAWTAETTISCPECGSPELEDAPSMCDTCGNVPPEEGDDFCAECRKLEDSLDAVKSEVLRLMPNLPQLLSSAKRAEELNAVLREIATCRVDDNGIPVFCKPEMR